MFNPLAMMPAKQPAGNLDQVRNGSAASPLSPVDWVNGNAGASNSHYKEGQSILYRLVLTNLPLGVSSVKIEWDITHSSTNAIDYITSVVRTSGGISETIHVCGDAAYNTVIAGCTEGSFTTFPIVAPPVSKAVGSHSQPTDSFNALPAADKLLRMYNGTITGFTYINNADGNLGDLNVAQSATRASISFNATSPTVVLAWGGHIASRGDWGFTNGVPNSAGGISGSPYHTRFIELCPDGAACGGGNQDRSLSAAAVAPPSECNLTGPDTVCEGSTNTYTVDAASLDTSATYTFALSNNTAGATIENSNGNPLSPPVFADVKTTGPGGYTITATASNAGGSSPGCPVIVNVTAKTSATDPSAQTACEGGSATFSTTASGTGPFTYQWQKDGVDIPGATSSSLTINPVSLGDAGTYRVIVTGTCGSATTAGALLTVNTTTVTSDPPDATRCVGGSVTFSTTPGGTGPFTYQWQKGGVDIAGATSSSLTLNNIATTDAGTYTVKTTGACNTASQNVTLTVNTPTVDISLHNGCDSGVFLQADPSGSGTFTYQWALNGVDIAGATHSTLVPTVPGQYSVTVHDGNSCPATKSKNLCFAFQGQVAMTSPGENPNVAAKPNPLPSGLYFSLVRLILGLATFI